MAKKKQDSEDVIIDVTETYSKTEKFINENKNTLSAAVLAIIGVVGIYVGYTQLHIAPLEQEAKEQVWKAQQYFEEDSFRLAIFGDGNYYGFETIVDDYSATKTGKLARYYLGISYLRIGEYELAIDALNSFSSNDVMLSAVAKGAMGDAYMELGDVENAAMFYDKAANHKANNFISPVYLLKAGLAYEMLGDYNNALKNYKQIKSEFDNSQEARTIDKYIARAEGKMALAN